MTALREMCPNGLYKRLINDWTRERFYKLFIALQALAILTFSGGVTLVWIEWLVNCFLKIVARGEVIGTHYLIEKSMGCG